MPPPNSATDGMTLLVTGGTGFLGSYFTRYALSEGGEERVVVLDKYPGKSRIADVLDRVDFVEGDVSDRELVADVIARFGIDRIAHFAFILGSPPPGRMLEYVDVQCTGTATVLECARVAGVKRVLFASSVAAYGPQDVTLLTEDLRCAPDNAYGFCKLWAESLTRLYATELGLDTITLRFGSTYGFGRAWRGSYTSGLLTTPQGQHYMARVEDAWAGKPVVMPGDKHLADFTYAGDAAQAAWLALTSSGPSFALYNVSSLRCPIGDLTRAMRAALPDAQITVSESETAGNPHPPLDNRRLVEDLGFKPRFDLESGIRDYIVRLQVARDYRATQT